MNKPHFITTKIKKNKKTKQKTKYEYFHINYQQYFQGPRSPAR